MTRPRLHLPDTSLSQSALPLWATLLVYLALLVAVQSLLTRLLEPLHLPPPDLFLLSALAFALRLRPVPALLAAYALGLGQDLLGAGALGLHAAGLAGAVLAFVTLQRWLSRLSAAPEFGARGQDWRTQVLSVASGLAGQWLTFGLLGFLLRHELVSLQVLTRLLPPLFLVTLLFSWAWDWVSRALLGQNQEGLD